MRVFIFILFLSPLYVFGQTDSSLFVDLKICESKLDGVSTYPWYNTIEINKESKEVKIFLLFYKIDTVLYENQTITVAFNNYEEELRNVRIDKKYFNAEAVITIVSLLSKNGFIKIEFNGVGDCTGDCILFTRLKDGYILSRGRCEDMGVCEYKPRKKGDRQINKNLLYIKNLKRYFRK